MVASWTVLTCISFKEQMWQLVATEMGIPWQSAELMHWELGEQGMNTCANVPKFEPYPPEANVYHSLPSHIPVLPASTL
jgi:hypothetical protein